MGGKGGTDEGEFLFNSFLFSPSFTKAHIDILLELPNVNIHQNSNYFQHYIFCEK